MRKPPKVSKGFGGVARAARFGRILVWRGLWLQQECHNEVGQLLGEFPRPMSLWGQERRASTQSRSRVGAARRKAAGSRPLKPFWAEPYQAACGAVDGLRARVLGARVVRCFKGVTDIRGSGILDLGCVPLDEIYLPEPSSGRTCDP